MKLYIAPNKKYKQIFFSLLTNGINYRSKFVEKQKILVKKTKIKINKEKFENNRLNTFLTAIITL